MKHWLSRFSSPQLLYIKVYISIKKRLFEIGEINQCFIQLELKSILEQSVLIYGNVLSRSICTLDYTPKWRMYEKNCLNLCQYSNQTLKFKTLIIHGERISIAKIFVHSLRYTCEGTFSSVKSILSADYLYHIDPDELWIPYCYRYTAFLLYFVAHCPWSSSGAQGKLSVEFWLETLHRHRPQWE